MLALIDILAEDAAQQATQTQSGNLFKGIGPLLLCQGQQRTVLSQETQSGSKLIKVYWAYHPLSRTTKKLDQEICLTSNLFK